MARLVILLLAAVVCVSSNSLVKRDANPCGYACSAPMCAPTCPTYCCAPPPPPPQMVNHVTHVHQHTVHHQAPQAPAMALPPMAAPPPATVSSSQHVWEYVPPAPCAAPCAPAYAVPAPIYAPAPYAPAAPMCGPQCAPPPAPCAPACPTFCCKKRSG